MCLRDVLQAAQMRPQYTASNSGRGEDCLPAGGSSACTKLMMMWCTSRPLVVGISSRPAGMKRQQSSIKAGSCPARLLQLHACCSSGHAAPAHVGRLQQMGQKDISTGCTLQASTAPSEP
jgi:hypothetical protein